MCNNFPKRRKTEKTAEIGVNSVSRIVNDDFGWIFRRTHKEHDFGVDGYIDYVTKEGGVSGKFIAVQIKTGESYLSSRDTNFWYRDSIPHLNYFLNLPIPILLILCDPNSRICYWSLLDSNKVKLSDESWQHPVPKLQQLCIQDKPKIELLFGECQDHVSMLKQENDLLDMISNHSLILYSVPKEDVENGIVRNLKSFLDRLTRSEKLVRSFQGKMSISIAGYEDDERELFQIRDVRRWTKKARRKISEWYLCTNDNPKLSTLQWVAACTCRNTAELKLKPDGNMGYFIVFEGEDISEFLEECFIGLNEAALKWGWPEDYIFDISKKIGHELLPDCPYCL